jgi:hypothetical protein
MAPPVYTLSMDQTQGIVGTHYHFIDTGIMWVVRNVQVYWNSQGNLEDEFRLIGDVGQTALYYQFTVSSGNRTFTWNGRLALVTALGISTTSPMDVTVTGYQLSLP